MNQERIAQIIVRPMSQNVSTASIQVPALLYKSGNRTWISVTMPFKVLGKFVRTTQVKKKNQDPIRTKILNRFLDPSHKKDIKTYMKTEKEFTIPPVTLVSSDSLEFKPYGFTEVQLENLVIDDVLASVGSIAGVISIPLDYEFDCLDGNHRCQAIRELSEEDPELIADSNILLNIVCETRHRKIRQDFVDVYKNAYAIESLRRHVQCFILSDEMP